MRSSAFAADALQKSRNADHIRNLRECAARLSSLMSHGEAPFFETLRAAAVRPAPQSRSAHIGANLAAEFLF
jgi:hypothetical protein